MTQVNGVHNVPNGLSAVVVPQEYNVPYGNFANIGTIQNRAPINNGLKPMLGVERIPINSFNLLNSEFGPNGEPVHEIANKDPRVRLVGGGWTSSSGTHGAVVYATIVDVDYIEVSFYGTGLNLVMYTDNTASRDYRATIDNEAEGSNLNPASLSDILSGRNYAANILMPVCSGLTLGWHTVKVTLKVQQMTFSGVEILNESAQLKIFNGAAIAGNSRSELSAIESLNYDAVKTGTKGGRVVTYLVGNQVKQAWQPVDTNAAYLSSADHSNEEQIRRINFREFGANRGDDFSTLSATASNRAFTLDDGTTTLVGNNVYKPASAGFYCSGTGAFYTIGFMGTGLDLLLSGGLVTDDHEVFVDGQSKGIINTSSGVGAVYSQITICSGLEYGYHTVKLHRNTNVVDSIHTTDFIIYQPKKPAIPAGSVEVADYNVMADFAATSLESLESISQGVLRKDSSREFIYTGVWSIGLATLENAGGWNCYSGASGSSVLYNHPLCTGFVQHYYAHTGRTQNVTVQLNGVDLSDSNFTINGTGTGPSVNVSIVGGGSFTASTGVFIQRGSNEESSFIISGLTLGHYAIKMTVNDTGTFDHHCFDIITPIHINNTKIGNLSLEDKRSFSSIPMTENGEVDWGKAKVLISYNMITGEIRYSKNVSAVLASGTGSFITYFEKQFKNNEYVMCAMTDSSSFLQVNGVDKYTGRVKVANRVYTGASTNVDSAMFAIFGELEDE